MKKDISIIPNGIRCENCPYRKYLGTFVDRGCYNGKYYEETLPLIKCEYLDFTTQSEESDISLFISGFKICGIKQYRKWCLDCKYLKSYSGYEGFCNKYKKEVDVEYGCEDGFEPNEELY